MGAGAIIAHLEGALSPEARLALAAFHDARENLTTLMEQCASGRELAERGFLDDVKIASEYGVSDCVPQLLGDAYVNAAG